MVLVIAGALQLDGLAIQQEAPLGVEFDGANSEGSFIAIHDLPAGCEPR